MSEGPRGDCGETSDSGRGAIVAMAQRRWQVQPGILESAAGADEVAKLLYHTWPRPGFFFLKVLKTQEQYAQTLGVCGAWWE